MGVPAQFRHMLLSCCPQRHPKNQVAHHCRTIDTRKHILLMKVTDAKEIRLLHTMVSGVHTKKKQET
jgi:hypothetical protein